MELQQSNNRRQHNKGRPGRNNRGKTRWQLWFQKQRVERKTEKITWEGEFHSKNPYPICQEKVIRLFSLNWRGDFWMEIEK